MRKNELRLLKWEDVDFKNNLITIPEANSKNKKQRRIPISTALRQVLLEQNLCSIGEYVFGRFAGKSKALINRHFETTCRKAGIQGLRFHYLRHTAATRMLEAGAKIQGVSKMLGHSNWNISMRYSHPDDSLKEAAEILANFCSNVDMEYIDDSKWK
jgi:integrase